MLQKRLRYPSEIASQNSLVKILGQISFLFITRWVYKMWQHGLIRSEIKKRWQCITRLHTLIKIWQRNHHLKHSDKKIHSWTFLLITFDLKLELQRTFHCWIHHENFLNFDYWNAPIDTEFTPESSFKVCCPNDL